MISFSSSISGAPTPFSVIRMDKLYLSHTFLNVNLRPMGSITHPYFVLET